MSRAPCAQGLPGGASEQEGEVRLQGARRGGSADKALAVSGLLEPLGWLGAFTQLSVGKCLSYMPLSRLPQCVPDPPTRRIRPARRTTCLEERLVRGQPDVVAALGQAAAQPRALPTSEQEYGDTALWAIRVYDTAWLGWGQVLEPVSVL